MADKVIVVSEQTKLTEVSHKVPGLTLFSLSLSCYMQPMLLDSRLLYFAARENIVLVTNLVLFEAFAQRLLPTQHQHSDAGTEHVRVHVRTHTKQRNRERSSMWQFSHDHDRPPPTPLLHPSIMYTAGVCVRVRHAW